MCLVPSIFRLFPSWRVFLLPGLFIWVSSGVAQDTPPTAATGGLSSELKPIEGENLIPAAFGIRTDRDGNSWNVEADGNIGRIGSTMVNSGLMLLIDEEKFTGVQPSMSPDGREFVIHGMPFQSLPGLRVQRRVKLIENAGGLCYAELFYNGSTDAMNISVGLATNFSGNYKTFLSDRGRSEPVIPSGPETAVIVMPGTSESPKAFIFTFSNAGSSVKPTISSQNRYGLTYRFQLSLEPGESRILVHHVAQVMIPQSFDRRALLKLSSPYRLDGIVSSLPGDWRTLIANVAQMPEDSQDSALSHGGMESLGILRGPRDILGLGGETRLPGEVEEDSIAVSTVYGDLEIDVERIAAITKGKVASKSDSRIFLTDGQILNATIKDPGLTFAQTGGEKIRIEPGKFEQLVMADNESAGDWRSDSIALIETTGGDRIKVLKTGAVTLGFSTLWGNLTVGEENLIWMKPAGGGIPGHQVELRDGTRCYGVISGEDILLKGTDFGDIKLPPSALRHIFTRQSLNAEPTKRPGQRVTVHIPGDQQIVGSLAEGPFPVLTGGGLIKTAASEIRRAVRVEASPVSQRFLPGDQPVFEIVRWDGGVIKGGLNLETIPLQAAGITWQIPLRDIEMLEIDSPLLTPEVATQIADLVLQLGAVDWSAREAATRELGAFGYLARPVLQRELKATPDPEVERRIKRILDELN